MSAPSSNLIIISLIVKPQQSLSVKTAWAQPNAEGLPLDIGIESIRLGSHHLEGYARKLKLCEQGTTLPKIP